MRRREFVKAATFGGAGLGRLGYSTDSRPAGGERPNVLMVIADDLTWRDCEPYGSKEVRTPNMARLAAEGVCFDAMYTGTAMCAPTRQQLYTGMFPVRNGAFPNHSWTHDGVRSLPHYLSELGYRTALSGKTHFGPPESFPFEIAGKPGADPDASDMSEIAAFVNRDNNQPYCLIVASRQPHVAWNKGDASAYPPDKLTVPEYLIDCPHTREALSKYYAEVTYLDAQLGAALRIVEESGQQDNTLIVFTSEQGAQLPFAKWTCYENGLRTAFIARWPGRVKPGSRAGAMTQYVDVVPTLIEAAGGDPRAVDTGRPDAHGSTGFDGRSFLPVLLGERDHHCDYVYGVQTTRGIGSGSACYPVRTIRSKRFRYIQNLNADATFSNVLTDKKKDGHALQWLEWARAHPEAEARARLYVKRPPEELYDLDADPYELNNIAGEARHAEAQTRLRRKLEEWMEQQGDLGIETEMQAKERKGKFLQKQRNKQAREE